RRARRTARRSSTTRSCSSSTRTSSRSRSRCRRGGSAPAGSSTSGPPRSRRTARSSRRGRRSQSRIARCSCCGVAEFRATYRLQLTADFGFREARAVVPYLQELGISHLYLSPSLQARRGSPHGYDVGGPTGVSEELGGEAGGRELCGAGRGVVLDVVPEHVGAAAGGGRWCR